jgi:hypothetical protein
MANYTKKDWPDKEFLRETDGKWFSIRTLEDYEPLCRSCHRRWDKEVRERREGRV